jgi:hypothetical protein
MALTGWVIEHWYSVVGWAFVALLGLFYVVLRLQLREARRYHLRLRLYHIRDEFRFLVAMGVLEEKGPIFMHFERLIDSIVRDTEKITLPFLMRAIKRYGHELTESKHRTLIVKQLVEASDPRVKELASDFYSEFYRILFRQSLFWFIPVSIAIVVMAFLEKLFPRRAIMVRRTGVGEFAAAPGVLKRAESMRNDLRMAAHC